MLISWGRQHPKTILVFATLACLLPFADKAVHIDDPLFLWAGRQMQVRWWDPYGFTVNWYGWAMPMHEVTKNPPLACALIAMIISIFGENEFALHLGFFLPAIAVVLGTYVLAGRFCNRSFSAALAVLFTPVFLVSGTTLMCDVLMVALWVWAVVFWMRGLETNRPLLLILAASLVGACSLAKYFGIALIPLLLAYSLMRKQKPGWWLVYLLIPLVILGAYEVVMRGLYGHGLIGDAFRYTRETHTHGAGIIAITALTAIGFVGGCCAIVLVFFPVLWRKRFFAWLAIVALALLPITWILSDSLLPTAGMGPRLAMTSLWTILILAGLGVLSLPIIDWKRQQNSEALFLLLWVWGTFLFCILNWSINGRSVLPMVPAVAILLQRHLEFVSPNASLRLNWFFGAAAMLSLSVSFADYRLANSVRAAVTEIQSQFGDSSSTTIWFQGHWGLQYYAETNGWRAFDLENGRTNPGDLIVLPFTNTNLKSIPENTVERIAIIEKPVVPWIATMNKAVGAGFYMDIFGPLPFAFGHVPREKYYVLRVK